jgi:DNA-binding FadR family transcriptional regulator
MIGRQQFDLISYFAERAREQRENGESSEGAEIPSLKDLSQEMEISIASLREQLGVARTLGIVDVRPRTGIKLKDYSFAPAAYESLSYAITCDRRFFDQFADLRRHIESNYWFEAVERLTKQDHEALKRLVGRAQKKLNGQPVRVPHQEHRDLHIKIFSRLENPFVQGILEAYWNAYENIGYSRYNDLDYLKQVWEYHQQIVDAICDGDFEISYKAMQNHMQLIDKLHGGKIE